VLGYFKVHGRTVWKTMALHFFLLFPLWYMGFLLMPINAAIKAAVVGYCAAMSVTLDPGSIPQITAVTGLTSLPAGWILDSIGSKIAMKLKRAPKEEVAP
jgi:hypothetical protein